MSDISRREFLKNLGQLGVAGATGPLSFNLMNAANAADLTGDDGYKAVVCYYLVGGCDQFNTLVPYDETSYNTYSEIRQNLALPRETLHPIRNVEGLTSGIQMALHPNLRSVHELFEANKVAVIQNIGPLVEPTDLQAYKAKSVFLPPELFSHAGQSAYWHTLSSNKSSVGWGGRIGDLLAEHNNENIIFTNISTGFDSVDLVNGSISSRYSIGKNGPVQLRLSTRKGEFHILETPQARDKILEMITKPNDHLLQNEISSLTKRSIEAEASYREALAAVDEITTEFPSTDSGLKLQAITKMISANAARGVRRQIFFMPIGGFDSHQNLLRDHGNLMETINNDISSFQTAMEDLNMSEKVSMVVASEFGRTLTVNGDGTDHGWGGHAYVIGDAVNGGFYGETPQTGLNTDIDVGNGRWLPTTPVEALSVTLARWLGVSEDDIPKVCPNFESFYDSDFDLGIFS